jgi:UPF0042 nucleotide-binding protein
MKLIIVSGLSGSGKSIALETLEDADFYCIDNLPVNLLEAFVEQMLIQSPKPCPKAAISIDSRNQNSALTPFSTTLDLVKKHGIDCEVLFLQAQTEALLKRFSETRRKHPLTDSFRPLAEAIELERQLLEPIARCADLLIDTTHTNVHQLRKLVRERVGVNSYRSMSLFFQSFGYKNGVPLDTDFVFDARCLPNPHWEPSLRNLTGKEPAVADFLTDSPEVRAYLEDTIGFLQRWIPHFEAENRSYLTIAVGCTGGQHRSVYLVEALAAHFKGKPYDILIRHRELP